MPFAHYMSIMYHKGLIIEGDAVSRRLYVFDPNIDVDLRKPVEMFALWWDGEVPNLCY